MFPVIADRTSLKITLGRPLAAVIEPGVPVLAGEEIDGLFGNAVSAGRVGSVALFQAGDWLLGVATDPKPDDLEQATHRLYRELIAAARGQHLARIWNFVPAINETGSSGLENYRAFCGGRSRAFEDGYGASFKTWVPAASAVGCEVPALTVIFAAGRAAPRHVENPLQIPACDYPAEYGPRPPSFARATIVPAGRRSTAFISGTAAIRGHATVAQGDLAAQLECTLGNLAEISKACGLGRDLARGRAARHFKVYLRHAADLSPVAARLGEQLLDPADRVSYVRADICRRGLLVEIEATLLELDLGESAAKR